MKVRAVISVSDIDWVSSHIELYSTQYKAFLAWKAAVISDMRDSFPVYSNETRPRDLDETATLKKITDMLFEAEKAKDHTIEEENDYSIYYNPQTMSYKNTFYDDDNYISIDVKEKYID